MSALDPTSPVDEPVAPVVIDITDTAVNEARRTERLANFLVDHVENFTVYRAASDSPLEAAAKVLHAETYLDLGYVDLDDICLTPAGAVLTQEADPFQDRSDYFVAAEEHDGELRIIASARMIWPSADARYDSFPGVKGGLLDEQELQEAFGVEPGTSVEISGLVKRPGADPASTFALYRAMWHHSLNRDVKHWLMIAEPLLFARLSMMFYAGLESLGEPIFHEGGFVVPAVMSTAAIDSWRTAEMPSTGAEVRVHQAVNTYFVEMGSQVPVRESTYLTV